MALYETLFDGPIDIIGDVHGEITALRYLLYRLGYDDSGRHKQGRRIVFLGDIIDRGPDSPGVVEAVIDLVKNGRAQCILGNHELNVLLDRPMHGNGWMVQPNPKDNIAESKYQKAEDYRIPAYREFFETLPVILENKDLRVVHACWNTSAVETLKSCLHESIVEVYERFQKQYAVTLNHADFQRSLAEEKLKYEALIRDPKASIPMLPLTAKKECLEQMMNPIRTITTSSMVVAQQPFYAGGKWRMAERDSWWDTYQDDVPVVIGHFWRQFNNNHQRISGQFGRDLFAGVENHAWMGARHNVFCADYSAGQRHLERKRSTETVFFGKLAALRMPERQVVHDDGLSITTY